jgi:hypothetical protein
VNFVAVFGAVFFSIPVPVSAGAIDQSDDDMGRFRFQNHSRLVFHSIAFLSCAVMGQASYAVCQILKIGGVHVFLVCNGGIYDTAQNAACERASRVHEHYSRNDMRRNLTRALRRWRVLKWPDHGVTNSAM